MILDTNMTNRCAICSGECIITSYRAINMNNHVCIWMTDSTYIIKKSMHFLFQQINKYKVSYAIQLWENALIQWVRNLAEGTFGQESKDQKWYNKNLHSQSAESRQVFHVSISIPCKGLQEHENDEAQQLPKLCRSQQQLKLAPVLLHRSLCNIFISVQ